MFPKRRRERGGSRLEGEVGRLGSKEEGRGGTRELRARGRLGFRKADGKVKEVVQGRANRQGRREARRAGAGVQVRDVATDPGEGCSEESAMRAAWPPPCLQHTLHTHCSFLGHSHPTALSELLMLSFSKCTFSPPASPTAARKPLASCPHQGSEGPPSSLPL